MKKLYFAALVLCTALAASAQMYNTPFTPIFKGIEHSVGTNTPDGNIPVLQVVHCIKIDLTDPDVQLFTTPRATNYAVNSTETYTLIVSNFLKKYNLSVACDANFYNANPGGSDPIAEGFPCDVYGLQISGGALV